MVNVQCLSQFFSAPRELLLHGILRGLCNRSYLLDAVSVEVEKGDGRAFLGRKRTKGEVEVGSPLPAPPLGECLNGNCINAYSRRLLASPVTEERVMGNLEEPRTELSSIAKTRTGKVGLHQSILSQVVSLFLIATTECKQEASDCLLLTLHAGYELFSVHDSR